MAAENKNGAPERSRYRAPAVDRGLDILEILAGQARGLTRAEIVRGMGLGPSQIYRVLERLVARGYVARLDGDRYALTMRLFLLAHRHPPLRRLVAQAQPAMDDFAREVRQSCHLVVPGHGAAMIIAQASPSGHWEFHGRVGAELDLFETASGQTLLAFLDPGRREDILGTWGIRSADPRLAAVEAMLGEVRRQGFRSAPSGQLGGVTDLSAPILGPGGDVAAVLTCAYMDHPGAAATASRDTVLARLLVIAAGLSPPEVRRGSPPCAG